MTAIKGIFREGRIEFAPPPDWPDACEVVIEPTPPSPALGMSEEDWPITPEGIAALLERWDSLEPLEMTADEEKALAEWRAKVKAHTIAGMGKSVEGNFE